jgi:hypothetical protein
MDKFKDLKKQCERTLDAYFAAHAGRSVEIVEVANLISEFEEHLPRGQAAIAMAKKSGLLRISEKRFGPHFKDLSPELKQVMLDARIAKYGGEYSNYFMIRMRNRQTWADLLARDPLLVKRTFGIPGGVDPARTVAMLCEALIDRAFGLEFPPSKLVERVQAHQANLRQRGYRAVIETADKPDVTLSDLQQSVEQALAVSPNLAELEAWQDHHFDAHIEGADDGQAVADADAVVRKLQRGGLDL